MVLVTFLNINRYGNMRKINDRGYCPVARTGYSSSDALE
jgi:hypothetical protein